MRHGKKINHLSRKSQHRKSLLANLAISLIKHKRIKTTVAKAKALRRYIEPLITKTKTDNTHSRRVVFSYLHDKYAVHELFTEISKKVLNRPGGYTRILRTGFRLGDNAEMCYIELVDYNENLLKEKEKKTPTKKKRTRRGGSKKQVSQKNEPESMETPKQEKPVTKTNEEKKSVDEQKPEEIKNDDDRSAEANELSKPSDETESGENIDKKSGDKGSADD